MSYPVRRDWSRSWPTPRWDPLAEFEAMRDRMNRLFGEVMGGGPGRQMTADVECDETDDAWLVEARLPGFAPDDVNVELVERELSITAHREGKETAQPGGRMMRQGDFSYHVTLPGEVDASGVAAAMDNGVLTVRLPKSPAAKPHRIEVATGRQLTSAAAQAGGEGGRATGVAEAPQQSQSTPPPPGAAPGPSGMSPGGRTGGGTTYQGSGQQYSAP